MIKNQIDILFRVSIRISAILTSFLLHIIFSELLWSHFSRSWSIKTWIKKVFCRLYRLLSFLVFLELNFVLYLGKLILDLDVSTKEYVCLPVEGNCEDTSVQNGDLASFEAVEETDEGINVWCLTHIVAKCARGGYDIIIAAKLTIFDFIITRIGIRFQGHTFGTGFFHW